MKQTIIRGNKMQQNEMIAINPFRWTANFILAVFVLLVFWGSTYAKAEIGREVGISDYAYIGGDYIGIDRTAKSVFYVETYQSDYSYIGSGSGFIMFDEGLFVTNQHVIDRAAFLVIIDDDGEQYLLDKVVVSDAEHDIAILLFPEGMFYNSLEYDTAFNQLKRGQPVLTIGSPKGLPGTVSDGIISAFPQFVGSDTRYIQITAPISHGSSGGCLLNEDLKVIGVTSSGVDEGQNLGFAIPVSIVEQLYTQWNKRDCFELGTESSWDTVGHGLHNRISGSVEKPTIQEGSSGNATGERQTGSSNDETKKQTPTQTFSTSVPPTITLTNTENLPSMSAVYPGVSCKAVIREGNTSLQKLQAHSGPGDNREYITAGAYQVSKLQNLRAYFSENGMVLTDIGKRMVYFYAGELDILEEISGVKELDSWPGKVIGNVLPRFGPGSRYDAKENLKPVDNDKIRLFFQQDEFVYAEYMSKEGKVRMWLPIENVELSSD